MKSKTLTLLGNVFLWAGCIIGGMLALIPTTVERFYIEEKVFSVFNFSLGLSIAVSSFIVWILLNWMAAMLDNSDRQKVLLTHIRDCVGNGKVFEEIIEEKKEDDIPVEDSEEEIGFI